MRGRRSFRIAALVIFAAMGSAAHSGELSTTSRGTVVMSVTIPPHLQVSESPTSLGSAPAGSLCVHASGIRNYHIRILAGDGSPLGQSALERTAARTGAGAGGFCNLPDGAAGAVLLTGQTPSDRPQSSATLTLLVIPE